MLARPEAEPGSWDLRSVGMVVSNGMLWGPQAQLGPPHCPIRTLQTWIMSEPFNIAMVNVHVRHLARASTRF